MLRRLGRVYSYSVSTSIKDKIKKEKLDRLKGSYMPTITTDEAALIRNFGIIAHIDAGKTTSTERMLYYAGVLPHPGEVHDGTTVMDYMPQERERGITIRSAAISFNWYGHQYNLIDTPGHIDFTAEVERSLRVLDGAIAIFDGVSGVETQSETVWFQANRFKIPRVAFINKMDRQGANLQMSLESMKDRLNVQPLILQIPLGEADQFQGVIDLIEMTEIKWVDKLGTTAQSTPIDSNHPLYESALKYREMLLENISTFDDHFAQSFLDGVDFTKDQIMTAIRSVVNSNPLKTCPVLLGSALKNKGIQPLLDSVRSYLPSPIDRPPIVDCQNSQMTRQLNKEEKLCAYTYKVVHDPQLGSLSYTRLYSGILESKQPYHISSTQTSEKITQIYRVRANKYVAIPQASAGDIVAIAGLKGCSAGSTITCPTDQRFELLPMEMPQCVFFAGLEYQSMRDRAKLDEALDILVKEDTSLKVTWDQGGQIVIGGLGELHLEVVQQRLKEQFHLETTLKRMQVEYREGIQESVTRTVTFQDSVGGRPLYFNLQLRIEPLDLETEAGIEVAFEFQRPLEFDRYYREFKLRNSAKKTNNDATTQVSKDPELSQIRFIRNPVPSQEVGELEDDYGDEKIYSIQSMSFPLLLELEEQVKSSLTRGSLKSYQMIGVRATIISGEYTQRRTNELSIGRCVNQLVREMLTLGSPVILEPIMNVEISTPTTIMQSIMNDLVSTRRGLVDAIHDDKNRFGKLNFDRTTIKGTIPLQETIGYSTFIRSISQGEASFSIQFKQYGFVGGETQLKLIGEV